MIPPPCLSFAIRVAFPRRVWQWVCYCVDFVRKVADAMTSVINRYEVLLGMEALRVFFAYGSRKNAATLIRPFCAYPSYCWRKSRRYLPDETHAMPPSPASPIYQVISRGALKAFSQTKSTPCAFVSSAGIVSHCFAAP